MGLALGLDAGSAIISLILPNMALTPTRQQDGEYSVFPRSVYNFGNPVTCSDGQLGLVVLRPIVEGKRCTGSCCLRRKVADWTAH
jgi:hypothetical protein